METRARGMLHAYFVHGCVTVQRSIIVCVFHSYSEELNTMCCACVCWIGVSVAAPLLHCCTPTKQARHPGPNLQRSHSVFNSIGHVEPSSGSMMLTYSHNMGKENPNRWLAHTCTGTRIRDKASYFFAYLSARSWCHCQNKEIEGVISGAKSRLSNAASLDNSMMR